MEGALDEIIQALITHEQAEKLKNETAAVAA
jgi:protein subunit release factor A